MLLLAALLPLTVTEPSSGHAQSAAAGWSTPVNISQHNAYDNAPGIAAAPDGSVSIVWERRVPTNPSANSIILATNAAPAGPLSLQEFSRSEPQKSSGSPRLRLDAVGRRHVVWWQQDASGVCDFYARIERDGRVSVNEQVPGSCGMSLKNTALAVGPDNSVHALFGRNLHNLYYWMRGDAGWQIQREPLPHGPAPEAPAIGVANGGQVIAAWKDAAPRGNGDIFAAARTEPGKWTLENVSASLTPGCEGNSKSDLPALAADPSGGMRMIWTDERCDPRNLDPTLRDVYYREWTPGAGWNALPPVRVARGRGNALENGLAVDASGTAHIVWTDTRNVTDIVAFYTSGRGTTFTPATAPFAEWARGEATKDISVAWSPGYVHVAFSSTRDDPLKENYYGYLRTGDNSPPTPSPPPAGSPMVPGAGSRNFPETGKRVTGLFLDYWDNHGGLAQQGFPISDPMLELSALNGRTYTVQYFERAVFEHHPENAAPYDVLLSQLGTFRYKRKYPSGAPNQIPNSSPGTVKFAETGRSLGGRFLEYWRSHGGLAQQGFPISDEFQEKSELDGKTYTVQYFERAVFELHPENQSPYDVLLSLLGVFEHKWRQGAGSIFEGLKG
jgi:hypothetical protein